MTQTNSYPSLVSQAFNQGLTESALVFEFVRSHHQGPIGQSSLHHIYLLIDREHSRRRHKRMSRVGMSRVELARRRASDEARLLGTPEDTPVSAQEVVIDKKVVPPGSVEIDLSLIHQSSEAEKLKSALRDSQNAIIRCNRPSIKSSRVHQFMSIVSENVLAPFDLFTNKRSYSLNESYLWKCSLHGTFSSTILGLLDHASPCPRCQKILEPLIPPTLALSSIRVVFPFYLDMGGTRSESTGEVFVVPNSTSNLIDLQDITQFECDSHGLYSRTHYEYLIEGLRCPNCLPEFPEKILTFSGKGTIPEQECEELLIRLGHRIERQKTFPDLKDVGLLRLDFWLPDHNIAIEYQGPFHYQRCGKISWADFRNARRRDQIKRDYCRTYGYTLIEIPFWEDHESYLYAKLTTD